MLHKYLFPKLDLQLFADGGAGDGGTGAEGAQGVTAAAALPHTKGAKNPLADVRYGIQDEEVPAAEEPKATEVAQPDRKARFEEMIKGEFKDLYDERMQNTLSKRLKGLNETAEKYNSLSPTLELLAKKYGIKDSSDIEALNKAISDDDSYFEDEAMEKGISVEQLKEIRKMERENAELKRQMQEQEQHENANRLYAAWMDQAENARQTYPSFDLKSEMANPRFVDLLRSNIDVKTAYEVIHKDEIIPAAMQFAAQQVEQKVANKIKAGGARPSENGMSSQSAAVVKSDVSQLSKEDRAEIIRRVQRGERIRF
jgi:hypothetical protein